MRERIGLDEEKIFICRQCKVLVGRDLVWVNRRRCALCGRQNELLTYEEIHRGQKVKGKNGKTIQRFPRLLETQTPEQRELAETIMASCRDFDCPGKVSDVKAGPVITEFQFTPDRFTRVNRLKTLTEDLALHLKADSVAMRRMPGTNSMGISISNKMRKPILYDEYKKNIIAHRYDMEVPLNMGITSDGEPYVEDLADMPHMLIGGSTGAGKSVFLNHIITNLLLVRSPKELRLVLIDPKSIELFPYKGIPHLLQEPISDVWRAIGALEAVEQEMRRRTANLHVLGADNIKTLNKRIKAEVAQLRKDGKHEDAARREGDIWPYIVVVIDEMADLMQQEKKLFTEKMAAIAQMARAAGICIIACTQRPSVDVLRGTIKVNFPARGSFRVTTQQDSKTVIGVKGAEQLLGKGDMWLSTPSKPGLQRIHVPLITREDRDKVLAIGLEYGHVMRVPADSMDANGNILPQKEQPKTPAAPTTPAVPVKNGKTTANSGSLKVN